MNMSNWKSNIISKKKKGSQTPGSVKGPSCQADWRKKYYATRSRSYKDSGYSDWCKSMDSLNGIKRG